ncbi:MAG: hypothetical protein PHO36_11530, partial [Parabacteroides sp.]|nr:hypothetical protein [Parabacteroides sp.]MDD4405389.1 hypothetical protein [Parabacteroides sp.]
PNREVKPTHADGTAYSGRVGSRRFTRGVSSFELTPLFFAIYPINQESLAGIYEELFVFL